MTHSIITPHVAERPRLKLVATGRSGQSVSAVVKATRRSRRNISLIERDELKWGNAYTGTAEALIAAKICRADQLPGQPGNQKTSCAYYRGVPCARNAFERDADYMVITVQGKYRFRVTKGVPIEEQQRRARALRDAEDLRAHEKKSDEYFAAVERLERRKRESTADVLLDLLHGHVDGIRRALQSAQQGEDLLHNWCLSDGDLQRLLRQLEGVDRVVREIAPIRHGSHRTTNLVVQP